jgi:hypothetical protein
MMFDFIDYHRQNQKNISGYKSSGYKSATKTERTDDDPKKSPEEKEAKKAKESTKTEEAKKPESDSKNDEK